jgi:NADH:ubiquinone oxidoreductase subunit H
LRTTLPRYRYDILIRLRWFSILPRSIMILILPTVLIQL